MPEGRRWDETIARLINTEVDLETRDGIYLQGKLTRVEMYKLGIDGKEVMLPSAVVLDNDNEKKIEISRILKLTSK